jgi:hypothetical protein
MPHRALPSGFEYRIASWLIGWAFPVLVGSRDAEIGGRGTGESAPCETFETREPSARECTMHRSRYLERVCSRTRQGTPPNTPAAERFITSQSRSLSKHCTGSSWPLEGEAR